MLASSHANGRCDAQTDIHSEKHMHGARCRKKTTLMERTEVFREGTAGDEDDAALGQSDKQINLYQEGGGEDYKTHDQMEGEITLLCRSF